MKQNQMYVCGCGGDKKCDCMVEVITSCDTCADTSPICCGEPMVLLEAKTADQGKEKHVPVIEKQDGGYLVKVGDVPHPMIEKHWITFIELRTTNAVYRKYLQADQEPQAFFVTDEEVVEVVAYCNIHGLWVA